MRLEGKRTSPGSVALARCGRILEAWLNNTYYSVYRLELNEGIVEDLCEICILRL